MSQTINGYPTTKTGAETPCDVTTTLESGDKCSLDVSVQERNRIDYQMFNKNCSSSSRHINR